MKYLYNTGKVPKNIIIIGLITVAVVIIFWQMSKKLEVFVSGEMEDQLGGNASVAAFDTSGR